jgi:putative oxidoreductase
MLKALGRLLLATIFISGGANTFMNPDGRARKVEDAGIPMPRQATILNGVIMVIAGSALAVGLFPKVAATLLIGSLIPTTFVGHPYWKEEHPGNRTGQQTHFLKNLSMLGALLIVLSEKGE